MLKHHQTVYHLISVNMRNINALPPCVLLCTIVFFYAWVPFAACCIWMRVFYRSGVYYDNVESLFGLKCHFVDVYQYQSNNCCQSVTGAANNQQLEDIYLAVFSIQLKSHKIVWDLYLLPKLHSQ